MAMHSFGNPMHRRPTVHERKLSHFSLAVGAFSRGKESATTFGGGWNIPVHLENTYKTDPDKKFPKEKVEGVIKSVLEETLSDVKYNPQEGKDLSKELSTKIKNEVKALGVKRYRIVSQVMLGPLAGTTLSATSGFIWYPEFDSYAEATYRNESMFAVGIVFGVFTD